MVSVIALDRSVELRRSVDDGTIVEVDVSVDANGDLVVSGHDTGKAPTKLLGSKFYDHWVVVGEEDKDIVLLHLLRERFADASAPVAEFMDWLQENGIPHEVGSEAGKRRGVGGQKLPKVARRPKRTRAGP